MLMILVGNLYEVHLNYVNYVNYVNYDYHFII